MQEFIKYVRGLSSSVYNGKTMDEPVTTLRTFRLHCPLNVIILTVLVVLSTYLISGQPMQCTVDASIPEKIMNTYCWIQSTYTLPSHMDGLVGQSVVAPGVGGLLNEHEPVKYHKYYQWVVFFLVFQALLFYIPHYIWDVYENGRLKMLLVSGAKSNVDELKLSPITKFLSRNLADNNTYFRVYIFCEFLNFINVIAQIFFIDYFLGYEFTTYGTRVLGFLDQETGRTDPMDVVFPKVSKCTFRKYGPSGNIVNYDGLCVLALNIFHEKIFVFLWFWFIILAAMTGLGLIWRLTCLFSNKIRTWLLRSRVLNFSRHPDQSNVLIYGAITRLPTNENPKFEAIQTIMNRLTPGDWFVLYQLSHNMWPHHFKQLVRELALRFGWEEPKLK